MEEQQGGAKVQDTVFRRWWHKTYSLGYTLPLRPRQDKDSRGVQKTETTEEVTSLRKLSERARVDRLYCDINRDFLQECCSF